MNAWPPLAVSVAAIGLAIAALVSNGGGASAILQRAVSVTARQESYRFLFDQTAGARGQTVSGIKMQGTYDRSVNLSRLTLGFGGRAGLNECTVIASDDFWYVQIPENLRAANQGRSWIKTDPFLSSPAQGLTSSTLRNESLVDPQAVDDVRRNGTESIRGVPTTRYRGTFDLAAALARAETSPLSKEGLERLQIPGKIPFSFWIDAQDRIRRTSYSFGIVSGPVTIETKLTYEVYDFGVKEPVTLPTNDEVAPVSRTAPGLAACLTPSNPLNR